MQSDAVVATGVFETLTSAQYRTNVTTVACDSTTSKAPGKAFRTSLMVPAQEQPTNSFLRASNLHQMDYVNLWALGKEPSSVAHEVHGIEPRLIALMIVESTFENHADVKLEISPDR